MEIKYEAVFGDQSLFDDAPEDCFCVAKNVYDDCVFYREVDRCLFWFDCGRWKPLRFMSCTPIAMRRIIRTPTWTVADQKAGRLPDVGAFYDAEGCRVKHLGVGAAGYEDIFHFEYPSGACGCSNKIFIKPIETPEEMEARLRSEWCNRAMDYSTIQQLYDAMLSGELAVPVAPEQNK